MIRYNSTTPQLNNSTTKQLNNSPKNNPALTKKITTFAARNRRNMQQDIALKIENLSKQYRLGVVGSQTLRGDLQRRWHRLRGKEDPTLTIGQENTLAEAGGEYIWALRDINLEVKKGEILGIIGKNGAGKSTLLKILSRVTGPTTGQIKINGSLSSLLEVGTGFHPELTGKENIYLNGAIMGMNKGEIRKKIDEIVEFAGVAKYIDTPVKRYSSGMRVRLGFAVAAFLEPDILIVDEVLAVGDAEFQKKAIGKMQDVSKGEGRTVLFVSHNMASVEMLCNRGVLMQNGRIIYAGTESETIKQYLDSSNTIKRAIYTPISTQGREKGIELIKCSLTNSEQKHSTNFSNHEIIFCNIVFRINKLNDYYKIGIKVFTQNGVLLLQSFHNDEKRIIFHKGINKISFELPSNLFNHGDYNIDIVSGIHNVKRIFEIKNCLGFSVFYTLINKQMQNQKKNAVIAPILKVNTID
jgi:lipopolysaccharide transport system ATP-binding protein